MISVTEHLTQEVRAALEKGGVGMLPLAGMDHHFCSLEKNTDTASGYSLLFPIEVDGKKAYVYLKI